MIEDYELYIEAMNRIKNLKEDNLISHEQLLRKANITQEQIDSLEDIEIE